MKWTKKLPARAPNSVKVMVDMERSVWLQLDTDDQVLAVALTLNQAGDVAHALGEALAEAKS